jgi:hypothetical protein
MISVYWLQCHTVHAQVVSQTIGSSGWLEPIRLSVGPFRPKHCRAVTDA